MANWKPVQFRPRTIELIDRLREHIAEESPGTIARHFAVHTAVIESLRARKLMDDRPTITVKPDGTTEPKRGPGRPKKPEDEEQLRIRMNNSICIAEGGKCAFLQNEEPGGFFVCRTDGHGPYEIIDGPFEQEEAQRIRRAAVEYEIAHTIDSNQ